MGRARRKDRKRLTDLIAIDPGNDAGIAVFHDQLLVGAELVVEAPARGWVWQGPYALPVVCEVPKERRGSRVNTQDLITLAFTAGYLVSSMQPTDLLTVFPEQWKGQRPKHADNHLTKKLLCGRERQILEGLSIPRSKEHNVLDAIGLGLWALGRR